MKPIDSCKIRSLVMATLLSIGLGFVTHASAQLLDHSYLIDLKSKTAIDLGRDVQANALNDAGQVVGWSYMADGQVHAFITGPNGVGMTDLNSLMHLPDERVMDYAVAINNMGQVLVPIPEPESYALMLAGLVLTGAMVRRKQKIDLREEAISS